MLKNYKFNPKSEQQSKEMQKLLFSIGYFWINNNGYNTYSYTNAKYLFTYSDGSLTYADYAEDFSQSSHQYMTLDQLQIYALHPSQAYTIYGKEIN